MYHLQPSSRLRLASALLASMAIWLPASAATRPSGSGLPDADAITVARLSEAASRSDFIPVSQNVSLPGATFRNLAAEAAQTLRPIADSPAVARHSARAAAPGVAKYGYIFSKDILFSGNVDGSAMQLTRTQGKDSIYNVYGLGTKIAVEINEAQGTFRIPSQKLYDHRTYGAVNICPLVVNGSQITYQKDGVISGTIDADGNVKLPAWGVIITEGSNAGRAFATFSSSEWYAANASIKITQTDNKTIDAYASVQQSAPNELTIYNFAGTGTAVTGILTSRGQLRIAPQYIATLPEYGDFYCYVLDAANNRINMTSAITGTAATTRIVVRDWAVAAHRTGSPAALLVKTSMITLDDGYEIEIPSAPSSFSGQGTAASPYLLQTPADMLALAQRVLSGESFKDQYLALAADIDMASAGAWLPIGDASAPFEGTFDGRGHTLKNLSVDARGLGNAGLFGYTGPASIVKGVRLADAKITGKGYNLGGIAGTHYGTISDCHVQGALSGESLYMGGIAGASWGPVLDCTFSGTATTIGIAGGITGSNFSEIRRCHVDADMTITGAIDTYYHDIAGIAGVATPGKDLTQIISDCSFSGSLTDSRGYGYMAGIVSKALNANITRCANTASISGLRANPDNDVYAAGIVAWCNESTIDNCLNSGTIVKTGSTQGNGGIVGYISIGYAIMETPPRPVNLSTVRNCYNSGQVITSYTAPRKGIWGYTFFKDEVPDPLKGQITNCYNDYQATGLRFADFDKATSELTSGSLPAGFAADAWQLEAGRYPVLKSMPANVAALASANLLLAQGETVNKVKKQMKIQSATNVKWGIYTSGTSATQSEGLSISGSDITLRDTYSTEIVGASVDGRHTKLYRLSVIPDLFVGEGTPEAPYQIRNVQDFINLDRAVSHYGQPHEGDIFVMTDDIDFGLTDDFQGVGLTGDNGFGGTFDGQGHTIHRLKIHSAKFDANGDALKDGLRYGGLFSKVRAEGTIRNVSIAADCDFIFHEYGGSIAGSCVGRIENCRNYADVHGVSHNMGGIAGQLVGSGAVVGCYNAGSVIVGGYGGGGIVAENLGLIERCQNDGYVGAERYSTLWPRLNQYRVGGIAGLSRGTILNCVNQGMISCLQQVGGIVGEATASGNTGEYASGSIVGCLSTGPVICTGQTYDTRGAILGKIGSVKEISGNVYDCSVLTDGSVQNCANTGCTPLTTDLLTSGDVPELAADSLFTVKAGVYPVLAQFASETRSQVMSSTYPRFAGKTSRLNAGASLQLASHQSADWSLLHGNGFTLAGATLTASLPDAADFVADTLRVKIADIRLKDYPVQSIRKVFDGEGTADSPYLISDNEDMLKLASMVADAGVDYRDEYFRLTADLSFTSGAYRTVATGTRTFRADFDGAGHSIAYGLNDVADKTGKYLALFGTIGSEGSVHDLTAMADINAHSYAAGIVSDLYGRIDRCVGKGSVKTASGYAAGIAVRVFQGASVTGCRNEAEVTSGTTYAAGIAAQVQGVVSDCSNSGAISSGSSSVGGIAANLSGTLTGCRNSGRISSRSYIGGIVGGIAGTGIVNDCHNTADIASLEGGYVAGIAGNTTSGSTTAAITGCTNTGNISGRQWIAGIVSQVRDGIRLDSCINRGTITSAGNGVGGVAGKIEGSATARTTASRLRNYGAVSGAGQYVGGVIGQISSGTTSVDLGNTGKVTNTKTGTAKVYMTGGVAGIAGGDISGSWSTGDVHCDGYGAGGFTGYVSAGNVSDCFATGNVSAGDLDHTEGFGAAGGFAGYIGGSGEVKDVYCTGTVTAPDYLGGLAGTIFNGTKISNAYTLSKVNATASAPRQAANITNYASDKATPATTTLTGVYYLKGLNTVSSPVDSRGSALTESEMMKAPLGDAFVSHRAAWPTLATFENMDGSDGRAIAHLYAAAYLLNAAGDTPQALTGTLTIEPFDDVVWSCSDGLAILADLVCTNQAGPAWLQAALPDGSLSRRFELNVSVPSGIDSITDEDDVVETHYYTSAGMRVLHPAKGMLYIVVRRHSDGRTTVTRIIL